jgi:hypothetical protein
MTKIHTRYGLVRNSLEHLKVFGCDAYVHVRKENRSKMDNEVEKCIFLDYKDGLKATNFGIHKLRRLSTVGMLFLERLKIFSN